MSLLHKNKSYAPILKLTSESMEKIKTLQENLKTYAPLMELTIKFMKKKRKKTIISFNQHIRPLAIG